MELVYTTPSAHAAYLGTPDDAAKKLSVNLNSDGRLEAFYIGTNDVFYHNWQDAPGGAWAGEHFLLEF